MPDIPARGASLPPESNRRFYPIFGAKGSVPLVATLLGETFEGFWTHWDTRPVPCNGSSACERCQAGQPHRWTGYIAAYDHVGRRLGILQLSEGAARQLLPLLSKHGSMRGFMVELRRATTKRVNAAVVVTVKGRASLDTLSPEFGIHDSLNRLWGLNEVWLHNLRGRSQSPRHSDGESHSREGRNRSKPPTDWIHTIEPDENGEVPLC